MKKLESILLATDFQPSSRPAVRLAADFARRFGSRVTVLHAINSTPEWPVAVPEYRSEVAPAMQEVVNELDAERVAVEESTMVVGHPVDTILQKAEEIDAHLIVIGAGRVTITGTALGPTADAVTSHSPIPVLAVHSKQRESIQSVLCPVDMSSVSQRGLRNAIWISDAFSASLLVVTVVPTSGLLGARESAEAHEHKDRKWRQDFQQMLEACDFGNVAWGKLIRSGVAHKEIAQVAKENQADLIVMGSSGRTGLTRALLGSVTRRVAQQLPCSILTVKHEDVLDDWLEPELNAIKILFAEAEVLEHSNATEAALSKYSHILARNPYSVQAIEGMARCYGALGNQRQAERCHNRAQLLQENIESLSGSI